MTSKLTTIVCAMCSDMLVQVLGRTLPCALLLGGAFCLLPLEAARAGESFGFFVNIDDTTDILLGSLNDSGYAPPTNPFSVLGEYASSSTNSGVITNETQSALGAVDIHAEYFDLNPLADNTGAIVNFNIFEPENPSQISDTLSIEFVGHGSFGMSVDLHFLSGSSDDLLLPPPLISAFSVPENSDVSAFITQVTGLVNAHVTVASVPEPSAFVMFGLGIASLFGYRLRKRFA